MHSIFTRQRALFLLAVKLEGVGAGVVVNDVLLELAAQHGHVAALVVVLCLKFYFDNSVADSFLLDPALLHLVVLLDCVVVDLLFQVAEELVDILADLIEFRHDTSCAVVVLHVPTLLHVASAAGLLHVGLAAVLVGYPVLLVTVLPWPVGCLLVGWVVRAHIF